ncbi:MAG: DUF6051 family protein [Mangrovibacterium sp.]
MQYLDSYLQLKELLKEDSPFVHFEGLDIYQQKFRSLSHELLPGAEKYFCKEHDRQFESGETFLNQIGDIDDMIHIQDSEIQENKVFTFRIFMPATKTKTDRAIFLFHGFNEKNWDKYFPWAQFMAGQMQCAVILFPIAFHMNRTLSIWSNKRKMYLLCEKRSALFPNVMKSSLTNVAISMRLHSRPQRFIWSGLQTYYDVIRFLEQVKAGENPVILPSARFHIVAYSIGCLLAEILKLANHKGYFSDTKLCLFCGGAVFNRLSPVSKYILDSEANIALYSYMVEHIEKHMQHDPHLKHYIDGPHAEGHVFYSMLDYKVKREYREELFNKVNKDILAITLKKDSIIPPYEIINTLQGALRDIPIPVDIHDFPFNYNHVSPFPTTEKDKEAIDEKFKMIFTRIVKFLDA